MKVNIVFGGLGYLGSILVSKLLRDSKVFVIDNLSNSNRSVLSKIKKEVGKDHFENLTLSELDVTDFSKLYTHLVLKVFAKHKVECVYHFTGTKDVEESLKDPLKYYDNNVVGTLSVLKIVKIFDVKNFVFSSSATVYGLNQPPFKEEMETSSLNPYGSSKLVCENMILEAQKTHLDSKYVCLRYFNPVGASVNGFLGDYQGYKNPKTFFSRAISSVDPNFELKIYGNNYDTRDGTCVRDFIHVEDLINVHLLCVKDQSLTKGFHILNVGSSRGYTLLEVLNTLNTVLDKPIIYSFTERREGDIPIAYASIDKIKSSLGWVPQYTLKDMINSEFTFFKKQAKPQRS